MKKFYRGFDTEWSESLLRWEGCPRDSLEERVAWGIAVRWQQMVAFEDELRARVYDAFAISNGAIRASGPSGKRPDSRRARDPDAFSGPCRDS